MTAPIPDHYATLGLDRRCTLAQIRAAYRLLAKRHHPDVNPGCATSVRRSQEINAAHEILSDPSRRRAYDRDLDARSRAEAPAREARIDRDIRQDAHLRIEDFLRGATLAVRVKDPANPDAETYSLAVPPGTAPGARFRIPRTGHSGGGFVQVRVKALPGFRFKARGSDLRCDLRIAADRATNGGLETIPGPDGAPLRIAIPARVARGAVLRIPGAGLPKPRGGRGDLFVRIAYRVEARVGRR